MQTQFFIKMQKASRDSRELKDYIKINFDNARDRKEVVKKNKEINNGRDLERCKGV